MNIFDIMAEIREIQNSLKQLIEAATATNSKLDAVEKRLENLEELQRGLKSVTIEVDNIRMKQNDIEQESKACLIRINGLSVVEADIKELGYEKAIMKKAYDKVIKPILTAAKNSGDIDSVPVLLNVLEQGMMVGKGVKDKQGRMLPPTICVRFINRYTRNTVVRLKKDHMPSPTAAEKAAGVQKYSITEDLTVVTAKKLKEIRDSGEVDKAWTIDGRIRYIRSGDPNVVCKLPSSFTPLEDIFKK